MSSCVTKVKKAFAISTASAFAVLALISSTIADERLIKPQTECDRMAGSPYDTLRNPVFSPVSIGQIDRSAADICRQAYEATGNPRFAYQLGRALSRNDEAEAAMSAYTMAVAADYAAAKVNFGMLMGRLGDTKGEFRLYTEAALSGNTVAAYNLGVAYRDGLGTDPDIQKSLQWFEKAASDGDDTAAFNIAVIHDEGQLVPVDDQTAIAWYDIAAQRGNTDAMINLGLMFETGEGIEANAAKAAELYEKAAANGDVFGAYKLLEMQELGIIPSPQDPSTLEGVNALVLRPGDMEPGMPSSKEI